MAAVQRCRQDGGGTKQSPDRTVHADLADYSGAARMAAVQRMPPGWRRYKGMPPGWRRYKAAARSHSPCASGTDYSGADGDVGATKQPTTTSGRGGPVSVCACGWIWALLPLIHRLGCIRGSVPDPFQQALARLRARRCLSCACWSASSFCRR